MSEDTDSTDRANRRRSADGRDDRSRPDGGQQRHEPADGTDGAGETDGDGEGDAGPVIDEAVASAEGAEGFEFDRDDDNGSGGGVGAAATRSGIAEAVSAIEARTALDRLQAGETFSIPEQATTVTDAEDGSMLETEGTAASARAAAAGRDLTHSGSRTRVLEFELGSELFCLDIDYIEEIVELENLTRVPNSPSYVEGVVDLRGQVTSIVNPKDALDIDDDGRGGLIVVFDSEQLDEQGHIGWVVDEVRQVTPVSKEAVTESPTDADEEHIRGVINRDDEEEFVVWTTPELALNSS